MKTHRSRTAGLFLLTALSLLASFVTASSAHADSPICGILTRTIPAPPTEATAVRLSIYGDGSNARLQVRLLPTDFTPDTETYYAAPDIRVDFRGWRTATLPLTAFKFRSNLNPERSAAPLSATDINAMQIALIGERGKVFVDELGWTTTNATPETPLLATIDDFSGLRSKWAAYGDYDQRRALDFGLNKLRSFTKTGKGSLQITIRTPARAEQEQNTPVLKARMRRIPQQTYFVYTRPTFETILPESTPNLTEVAAVPRLAVNACADQIEAATFAVYAGKPLTGVTVRIGSPFLSESKQSSFPSQNIDIHVVKVWQQGGLTPFAEGDTPSVPELLLKDDRAPLTGPLPDVRLTGDPITDIPTATSKQFWVTVHVSKGQAPALYTGNLIVSAPGVRPTTIRTTIEVYPMRLRSPFLQYGIDFRSRLGGSFTDTVVAPEVFTRQLEDIRNHGFRFVSLYDPLPTLPDALKLYQDAGMSAAGPIVLRTPLTTEDDIKALQKLRTTSNLNPALDLYYGATVPKVAHKSDKNAQVVSELYDKADYDLVGADTDVAIYGISGTYVQQVLKNGKRERPQRDWWTWDIAEENPRRNRLLTGYELYRTNLNGPGLYGAFPGPYQAIPAGTDPFNETAGKGVLRPEMVAYTAKEGMIDTLEWEAARTGIDDIRYITNLKTYIRDLKDLKIRKDATDEAETYLATQMRLPLGNISPGDYANIRRGIATRALKLLTILRSKVGIYPD